MNLDFRTQYRTKQEGRTLTIEEKEIHKHRLYQLWVIFYLSTIERYCICSRGSCKHEALNFVEIKTMK